MSVVNVRPPALYVVRSSFFGYFDSCTVQPPLEYGVRQRRLMCLQARQIIVGKGSNKRPSGLFEERHIDKFGSF